MNTSTKTKREILINIESHIETKCVVTTSDSDEDTLEYAKSVFIESMESRGIYLKGEPTVSVVEVGQPVEPGQQG